MALGGRAVLALAQAVKRRRIPATVVPMRTDVTLMSWLVLRNRDGNGTELEVTVVLKEPNRTQTLSGVVFVHLYW